MDIEEFRKYCLSKAGVTESFPFGSETLVFKVMDKMFALTDMGHFNSVNLKCDPDKAVQLRETYDFVRPGYHMSKKHWNTVDIDWRLQDKMLREWIDDSNDLVVASLPKKKRDLLINS